MMSSPDCGSHRNLVHEGKVDLDIEPSGGPKGPGKIDGVFYNPAMVQNRDLSMVIMQEFVDSGALPGSRPKVLDSLTGAGIRAIRFVKEVNDIPPVVGCDINPVSIDTARKNAELNGSDVEFLAQDVRELLLRSKYSYVDIDPFGSPLPFFGSALGGILNGGIIAVTATDTAALTGSVKRVARRRYGVKSLMTHFYQELSCRVLLGSLVMKAASHEISLEPVLFYAHDHFIRGYVKVARGAKRADRMLDEMRLLRYDEPRMPAVSKDMFEAPQGEGDVIGPIWMGPLEDTDILEGMIKWKESDRWSYLSTFTPMMIMLERARSESTLPPFGFDVNETSAHIKCSPPRMEDIRKALEGIGFGFSRSRFSPTIFKTDAGWEDVKMIFTGGGGP